MNRRAFLFRAAVGLLGSLAAGRRAGAAEAKGTNVLIIRHAEKSDDNDGLTPAGEARTKAYIAYFQNLKRDGESLTPGVIFATADTGSSRRPRLTVEPVARALGLTVDTRFKNRDVAGLANEIRTRDLGKNILVCWHHGEIPALLQALGAEHAEEVLPGGGWPGDEYDWMIEVRLDEHGQFREARRVDEGLTARH